MSNIVQILGVHEGNNEALSPRDGSNLKMSSYEVNVRTDGNDQWNHKTEKQELLPKPDPQSQHPMSAFKILVNCRLDFPFCLV